MTRIFTFLAALMLAAAGAVAETVTASGTIVTKPVSLPSQSIYELRTQTAIDIEYTQSATVKAELEAPANLFEYIKIEASNSVLSVRYKDNTQIRNSKKTPKLRISAPSVRTFRTNSAGDIKIMTDLTNSSTIQLIVNSAGYIKAKNIDCTECKLTSNSAGDIEVENIKANSVSAIANSAGDVKISSAIAKNAARFNSNSAGDIDCSNVVATILEASSSSSGDIKIKKANVDNLTALSFSAGDISISGINATSLKATSGSSGDISLSGNCQNAVLTASSASSIMAGSLKTLIVNASCQSSSSSITCHALERCEASVVKGASFKNTASGATVIK